ncbi:preprotein translocase subunit SecG [Haematobacter missouriensis]|uniref:Protein-export membrane protein SecG n=1 Tax=Haematobacter missouriensis TaxID=366616 RepID=A0A212AWY8_9RHOB|nr:preprotein translocase subunit SecG [Haematobacter missouriensis]KFI34013.1 preprotein translocase subunit SecG [Haematobacter missouriensis]OWJ78253.1 preprotein translocase subunit SecG [Haematobacter missouriensis]OWJ86003.1 preprotein translocase subunit SecG [Haematobacter missouriensis]
MENILLIIHLLLALALIVVVLLQRSEGGGLGMGSGGGGTGVMTGRQAANALTRLTWGFAVAFLCTSVALTIISAERSGGGSVLDRLGSDLTPPPAASEPALPADGGSLLPPSTGSAPATPPRAD